MCYANFSSQEEVDHPRPMTEMTAVPFSRGIKVGGVGEEVEGDKVEEEAGVEAIEAEETLGLNSVRLEVQKITHLTCKNCFVTCLKTKIIIISTIY